MVAAMRSAPMALNERESRLHDFYRLKPWQNTSPCVPLQQSARNQKITMACIIAIGQKQIGV
jgi:hypothetical protein